MLVSIKTVMADGPEISMEVPASSRLSRIIGDLCTLGFSDSRELCFILDGKVLDGDEVVGNLELTGGEGLMLSPAGLGAAVDERDLMDEFRYLREQFPLVTMIDLMTYEGKLRCERGPVKDLADRNIWPFTEYVKWHKFRMVLSFLHPYKPPTVTWLTDISHPNIIPGKKGKVCVSVLGKKWLPNTKLAAVVNALYFLLSDPNPYSAYPNKRCKEVAKICTMFGFPMKRVQAPPVRHIDRRR